MSDVGQALKFKEHYGSIIAYNPAMKFVVYDQNRWVESEELALAVLHQFTNKQIMEAFKLYREASDSGDKERIDKAKAYLKFVTS